MYSHVEGYRSKVQTTAYTPPTSSGSGSGVTGGDDVQPDFNAEEHRGEGSHAEGILTISSGYSSHAEGAKSVADGIYAHSEGFRTYAKGNQSHAEGLDTSAIGANSHAEGSATIASGSNSHAEGWYTRAANNFQHVEGKFNADNPNALHIVGNGLSDTDRKNAFEVLSDGRAKVQSAPVDDDDVVRKGDLSGVGGGTKLYMHKIYFQISPNKVGEFQFYSNKSTPYTSLSSLPTMDAIGYIYYPENEGIVKYNYLNPEPILSASGVVFDSETNECKFIDAMNIMPNSITDYVTEL